MKGAGFWSKAQLDAACQELEAQAVALDLMPRERSPEYGHGLDVAADKLRARASQLRGLAQV